MSHPITGSSALPLQSQNPMIRQMCTCTCVGWAEILVRRPTGSMSWVMRIQNQMYQDLFAVDDVFPTLHDISNLFMPSFGAMSVLQGGGGGSEEDSPNSLRCAPNTTDTEVGVGRGEVEKLALAAGFHVNDTGYAPIKPKVIAPSTAVDVAVGGSTSMGLPKVTSGPIAIPKQPKAVKESGSISDRDSDDGLGFADEDEEGNNRSRNPVRRVNSSPEMSSNYRNPYLLNKQQQLKEKDSSNNTSSAEITDGDSVSVDAGGQQWKKGASGGYSKDMRVSCEAIPEEMSGQTPPSKVGSVASNEDMLAGETAGRVDGAYEKENKNQGAVENNTGRNKEETFADDTATATLNAVKSPKKQQQPQRQSVGEDWGLKVQVSLKIPTEKSSAVVTTKPPQSPAPLSPRSQARTVAVSQRAGDSAAGQQMPFGGGPVGGGEEMWRGRSNTISVVQERHTKHSMLRGRSSVTGSGPSSGVGGLGSAVSSSGSIPSRTSGRANVGVGSASGSLDGGVPRPSGISPSFVFLQLFHSDQKPLLVDSAHDSAIKLLDLMPPMEVYKVGVLYIGPGQVDKEQEFLKNRCGSYRYTRFLSGLGSLLSVRQAKDTNTYTSLDPKNAMDGKFTYIWQDDIAQLQFHVATLMPTRETDPNCGAKKSHIGNDFVMIIYNESGKEYDPNTFKTEFNYASVVVEPLEMRSNRISVKVRENLIENRWEAKIVSDDCAPLLARQLALHANVSIPCMNMAVTGLRS